MRSDARKENQLRSLSCEIGVIQEATGSAKLCIGNTIVIASVYGPSTPKYSRHENFDHATLDIEVTFSGENDSTTEQSICKKSENRLEGYLYDIFQNTIQLSRFPKLLFVIKILVINNDGSLQSTCCNACSIALLDSGIPLYMTPLAINISIFKLQIVSTTTSSTSSSSSSIIIDPLLVEENNDTYNHGNIVITYSNYSSTTDYHHSSTSEYLKVIHQECHGSSLSFVTIKESIEVGRQAGLILMKFIKDIIADKCNVSD